MKSVSYVSVFVILCAFLILPSGCQPQEESAIIKKAKIVGQQNIELKKQLKEKDKEIENQKKLVAQCKEDMNKAQLMSGDSNIKLLKMVADLTKQLEQLKKENADLKEKIKALEESK